MTRRPGIRLDETDTVVTLLEDAEDGDAIEYGNDETIDLAEDVPFGHTVALVAHEADDEVRKYGEVIGGATESIDPGEWVHTHNCVSLRGQVSDVDAQAEGDAAEPKVTTE